MKTEYVYVILNLHGKSQRVCHGGIEEANLAELLSQGWRPVRETPLLDGAVLILLEHEPDEKFGFGFGAP